MEGQNLMIVLCSDVDRQLHCGMRYNLLVYVCVCELVEMVCSFNI